MAESVPLIHFDRVTIRFNNHTVISDICFTINSGDKFLIYGKSGIGKTTIFRLLLGFEPVQNGRVSFEGETINEQLVWDIRKRVAYVSQNSDIGSGQVQNLINTFFGYTHNRKDAHHSDRLMELIAFLDLPEKILQEQYEKLSGGEKQRIMLIIALLLNRNIFLLDEVTSSLDRELKLKVIHFFLEHPEWTVVSISHDQDWLNKKGLKVLKVGE